MSSTKRLLVVMTWWVVEGSACSIEPPNTADYILETSGRDTEDPFGISEGESFGNSDGSLEMTSGDGAATCNDDQKNGNETDVDCGGSDCSGCEVGASCVGNADCVGGECREQRCVSPTCGNGVIDGSEACDTGGVETSSCDADCSLAVCGDGYVNTLAAEICDGGGETQECDIDCTPSACGDGLVNSSAGEVCDGDGVGNGGETATCDNDCTEAVCGDGMINTSADESCDDSNMNNVDECTNACQVTTCDDSVRNSDEIDVDCGGRCGPGSCDLGQACIEDDDCSSRSCNESIGACSANSSCLALLSSGFESDGIYSIDPDGAGPGAPFDVYCDMTNSGGGWTLIARFSNADASNWMLDSGELWYDRVFETGEPTDPSLNEDAQSEAFWRVPANELRLTRSDELDSPTLFRTTSECLAGTNFRDLITSFGNFRNGAIWNNNAVAQTCLGVLEGHFATTSGFEFAECDNTAQYIGAPSSVSFWSAWSVGDGAVIMIGGGGNACSRADHGIGVTESNNASFDDHSTYERDFGRDASQGATDYSLNLWVR